MEIIVPQPRPGEVWPTLGPQICDFIEDHFVYGPGSLRGQPYVVRDDVRYLIYRAYEHYPEGHVFREEGVEENLSGRRHFKNVIWSVPKGSAKTEIMAILALVELHPEAPVRFNGYDDEAEGGMAPGRSIVSPEIPMYAPTKDQLQELAYGAASVIAGDVDEGLYDVNKERIQINGEAESKIIPVASNAGRVDGLKPTFLGVDESHRLIEDRHLATYKTLTAGLGKRKADDPWMFVATTAGDPSEPSVARSQYEDGLLMAAGKKKSDRTFFYHRQTSDENAKFDTMGQRMKALKEASGPWVAEMRDLFDVATYWDDSDRDKSYLERVWCNRWVQSSNNAFDKTAFEALGNKNRWIPEGSKVTLGFDGATKRDSTALVMTEVATGVQNLMGLWERPEDAEEWEVPYSQVDQAVQSAFKNFDVVLMYCDPPYWTEYISKWEGLYEGRVIQWHTKVTDKMYYSIRAYQEAVDSGALSHNGNEDLVRHIGNAGVNKLNQWTPDKQQKFILGKINIERKFDAAMAAILSWQARLDALKKGEGRPNKPQRPRRFA